MLGVALDERETQVELALEASGRLELFRCVVDAHRSSPAAREPRRDVRRAAAELDRVEPVDVLEHADVGLRDAPDVPPGLVRGPGPVSGIAELLGVGVPRHAVAEHVIAGHESDDTERDRAGRWSHDRADVVRTDEG